MTPLNFDREETYVYSILVSVIRRVESLALLSGLFCEV